MEISLISNQAESDGGPRWPLIHGCARAHTYAKRGHWSGNDLEETCSLPALPLVSRQRRGGVAQLSRRPIQLISNISACEACAYQTLPPKPLQLPPDNSLGASEAHNTRNTGLCLVLLQHLHFFFLFYFRQECRAAEILQLWQNVGERSTSVRLPKQSMKQSQNKYTVVMSTHKLNSLKLLMLPTFFSQHIYASSTDRIESLSHRKSNSSVLGTVPLGVFAMWSFPLCFRMKRQEMKKNERKKERKKEGSPAACLEEIGGNSPTWLLSSHLPVLLLLTYQVWELTLNTTSHTHTIRHTHCTSLPTDWRYYLLSCQAGRVGRCSCLPIWLRDSREENWNLIGDYKKSLEPREVWGS